jgi:hypothetical protein
MKNKAFNRCSLLVFRGGSDKSARSVFTNRFDVLPMLKRSHLLSLILTAAALLSQGTPALAQTSVPCNDWRIEVCEEALPISSNYGDPGCEDDCYRMHYYFYLVDVGEQSNLQTPIEFEFNRLFITGTLAPNAWQLSISGPGLSDVNLAQTLACAPTYPGLNIPNDPESPLFSYDVHSNMFAYEVSATGPLTWDVYGRMPLFTLSVDAFPGESLILTGLRYTFELWDGEDYVDLCDDAVQTCSMFVYKTQTQPTTACTTATAQPYLRLGSAVDDPKPGFPMRKKMPVWMAINPADEEVEWEEIDFLLTIDPQTGTPEINGALVPWIEDGLVPASSVQGFKLQNKYRLYTHHIGNIAIEGNGTNAAAAHNTLFYIVFDGPELESDCAGVDVGFADRGRMDGGDFDCCKPTLTGDSEAVWDAQDCVTQECADIELSVKKNTTYQAGDCSGLIAFDLFATTTSSTTIYLRDIRCALKVKKTGTFALDASETYSPVCSSNDCITATDVMNTYLRVVFEVDQENIPLSQNDPTVLLATIVVHTEDEGCIEAIDFLDAVVFVANSNGPCLVETDSEFSADTPDDDICSEGGMVEISAETADGLPIEYWDYYINYLNDDYENCRFDGHTDGATASHCVCVLEEEEQNVVLNKDNDPLNGVSTFDLVLINKHILGLGSLNGFKQLAGDINMSGIITSLDLLELRKLILGIYTDLPNSNSWRFIDKDLKSAVENATNPFPVIHPVYQGPGNPPPNAGGNLYDDIGTRYEYFADEEFEEFAIPPTTGLDSKVEFVGVKVGDVNGNVEPGSFQSENTLDRAALQSLVLGTHVLTGRTGQNIEIPVFGLEQKPLLGWQAALGFDTALLRVTGVRWAFDISDGAAQSRGWNLAAPGELRLLWFGGADTYTVEPGRPLFFVQAELLRPVRAAVPLLYLHLGSIPSEAYDEDHRHFALQLHTSDMALLPVPKLSDASPAPRYHLSAYPNPTAAVFRLQIEATVACSARLRISDALGRTVLDRSLELVEGLTVLPAAQMPKLTPGTYLVSLHTPTGVEPLRILRK